MTTIDLSTPPPPATGLLDALPRRVALTLPELQLVARLAGGAPLPFEPEESPAPDALAGRLGATRGTQSGTAYQEALAGLHDPTTSLTRRGLLVDDLLDEGLAGAVGLLATPDLALDIDLSVERVRVKAWHRQAGEAVASLATCDGVVFELAWFPTRSWAGELSRVAVLPEDLTLRESLVPDPLSLPYLLADAAVEAAAAGRSDVLQLLVGQHSGSVRVADRVLPEAEVTAALSAIGVEAQGRLRAMVADISGARSGGPGAAAAPTVVGVRSWVLLADGWRCLRPHDDGTRIELRRIEPSELGADLAPILSEVSA